MGRSLVLIILLASSSIVSAGQQWVKATSPNFELYTTAGEQKAREAILYFEQVNRFFQLGVHAARSAKGRVRIVAFASEAEYGPYRLSETAPAYSGGDPGRDEIVMGSISADDYPVAIHEYVHILLKPIRNVPLWLNEGLAELFSSLHPEGGKVLVGSLLPGRLRALQSGDWMDLQTLCAVNLSSPYYTADRAKQQIFYAESWALTHMLALSGPYRPKFPDFLRLTAGGVQPATAFQRAFGKQMPDILADLRQYIHGERFTGLLFDVALAASAQYPEIRPATPLESGLVLASVLADIRKVDEARQSYQRLAQKNPTSPEVPEALGYLAWRTSQPDEALAEFAKAVQLGSRNARVYYDYSALLGDTDGVRPKRVALLRTAVALDPAFQDARYHLGLLLVSEQQYEGALAQFAGVTDVRPEESFEFYRAVAYAAYETGDDEKARASVRRAAKYAGDPAEKASVAQLASALGERLDAEREPSPTDEPAQFALPRPTVASPLDLQSTAAAEKLPGRLPRAVEGTLDRIDCMPHATRMHVIVDGRAVLFLTDERRAIEVRGRKGRAFALACGTQRTRPAIRVEYDAAVDKRFGTIGVVRAIELK